MSARGADPRIESQRAATDDEWDEIWQASETATFFHSREWSGVWERYTTGRVRPDARLVTFSDGVRALLPVSRQRLLGGRRSLTLSSPAGTYGGWLAEREISDAQAALLVEALCGLSADLVWRLNPLDGRALAAAPADLVPDTTQMLDLRAGFDTVEKSFSRGHRSASNKARRSGVRVGRATNEAQWRAYFDVYRASCERWGATHGCEYGWRLFAELRGLGSEHVELWLATLDDTVICGALCFMSAKHVVYWHGAALAEYFALRPATLLMREIILAACAGGFRWFDFNPSAGLEGVAAFKERFGAQVVACPEVVRTSRTTDLERMLRTGARRLRLRRPRRAHS